MIIDSIMLLERRSRLAALSVACRWLVAVASGSAAAIASPAEWAAHRVPERVRVVAPTWVRLTRRGNVVTGACSADGVTWSIVGSGTPGGLTAAAGVGMFVSAVNGGASDRLIAKFDHWTRLPGTGVPGPVVGSP